MDSSVALCPFILKQIGVYDSLSYTPPQKKGEEAEPHQRSKYCGFISAHDFRIVMFLFICLSVMFFKSKISNTHLNQIFLSCRHWLMNPR